MRNNFLVVTLANGSEALAAKYGTVLAKLDSLYSSAGDIYQAGIY